MMMDIMKVVFCSWLVIGQQSLINAAVITLLFILSGTFAECKLYIAIIVIINIK